MSAYLINRDGQELGSFETSQIQEGLKTDFFRATDLAWREGMASWQALPAILDTATAPQATPISTPISAPVRQPTELKKPDGINPYSAPTSNVLAGGGGAVPPAVIAELKGTKPWVRFISILMWIGCVLMMLFVVFSLLFGASVASKVGGGAAGAGYLIGMTLGYVIGIILIIYPTLKLSKYASCIARLSESSSFNDLTAALAEQRRFWKFYGILMLIYLSIIALFVIGSFFITRSH